jgi:SAM-dependent methyltransferase
MKDVSLRTTFDEAASIYGEVRPSYPQEIIDDIISLSGITLDSRILEVGVGTGQMTLPFAKRGYEILGLELGPALAEQARKNLATYPSVRIEITAFEDWKSQEKFDLFLSAQAFHWIEPAFGLRKAADLLKESGAIALVWNQDVSQETAFYKAATPLYDKYVPDQPNRPTPEEAVGRYGLALSQSVYFEEIQERSLTWEITYSKENFLRLQNTFSNQLVLSEETRAAFHQELGNLIDVHGGDVVRHYKTVLVFARHC